MLFDNGNTDLLKHNIKHTINNNNNNNTFAPSHVDESAIESGAAAEKADKNKRLKYAQLCQTYEFVAVAIETTGTCSNGAVQLISELGRRISALKNDGRYTAFLWQQISVAVQRGNAICVSATHPITDEAPLDLG